MLDRRIPLIQAALNGDRSKADHAAVPLSIEELVRDAVACVAAGAGAIHMHPRDTEGRERLDPEIVNDVISQVRAACGVPVGITTGEWIEPNLERRLAMIRGWRAPDYASVNICEAGSVEVMRVMIEIGVGIEAGLWCAEDAESFVASGLGNEVTRILVEPGEQQVGADGDAALALVETMHRTLDEAGITVPRLQHADGRVTWTVLKNAFERGVDTRVGMEDTLVGFDGERTTGNAELVSQARAIRDQVG